MAGDVDVNSGKFAVTASDGSLAISSNKFTVAGDTGNTVVAGTLNATGAATLSSTLDVAGDVDVNSGKFTVDASTGNTVVAGSLDAGSMTVTSLSMVSASISGTMDVAGASNLTSTLSVSGAVTLLDDLEMSKQSVALTHSGSTGGGLSITSTNGYVEISSTASYVDVESVRVTGAQMGVSGDTDIITLSSASGVGNVAIAGELNVSLDVDVGSSAFVVTASDGSLAISSNKFTVAGDTGNTVVAGTLNATGAATLSSTLDVAGDVDVNSGKFAVTASDGSLAISSNKFTVAGDTGNTVVAGTLNATGCCDAVEHAGCGRRRGREQWEVCWCRSLGRVADDLEQVHGGWRLTHGGGPAVVCPSRTRIRGDLEHGLVWTWSHGCAGRGGTECDVDVNSGKFVVTA